MKTTMTKHATLAALIACTVFASGALAKAPANEVAKLGVALGGVEK